MFSEKGKPVRPGELTRALRKSRLLVVGDDRLVSDDQAKIIELLSSFKGGAETELLTSRARISESSGSPLLAYARKKGWKISTYRDQRSFGETDQKLVKRLQTKTTSRRTILWTGALRLSPNHLPKLCKEKNIEATFVCLEAAEARWESGRVKGWVTFSPDLYLFVERSPLLSLEHYRAWSTNSDSKLSQENRTKAFHRSLQTICKAVGQKLPPKPTKIFSPFELEVFQYLSDRRNREATRTFIWDRLVRGESALLPRERMVLLSTLDEGHLAEEAAHYLRLWNVGEQRFGPIGIATEEALAFMASTWIDPDRRQPLKTGKNLTDWEEVHQAGYQLGALLAKRWRASKRARRVLQEAFWVVPTNEADAEDLWQLLCELL